MLAHSLATRTADFLRPHPPFSYLPAEALEALASQISIRYFREGDRVVRQGAPPDRDVYVLHKGKIEVVQEQGGSVQLIDYCEIGDTFGVRALLTAQPYVATARAANDCLVYAIPESVFAPLLEAHPQVALYYASGFAAGMTIVRSDTGQLNQTRRALLPEQSRTLLFREEDVIELKPREEVVFCLPRNTVQEAAEIMTEYRVGSIVVANEHLHPVGIVTATDMTRKVGTGRIPISAPVTTLMVSPVQTVKAGGTIAEVILIMMKRNIRHLVVTEDGSPTSRFVGIYSEHDVLQAQGNNPAVLVKRLRKARHVRELAEIRDRAEDLLHAYLQQEISVDFVTGTATEVNDALIRRAIELAQEELVQAGHRPPAQPFCWLSLGSEGRGEQLLRTDQDNALLYADPPPDEAEATAAYFLRLGQAVTDVLEACGFAHCPGEIMASNPRWNQPLSGWKAHFRGWIREPEPKALMHGTIFFDFRPGYGDVRLAEALTDFLFAEMEGAKSFINFFAQNALGNPPPLSFLKQFIVERGGKHKDTFDIKLRGMMPLADAARVLLLHHRVGDIVNTALRYARLAELEPVHAALFSEAAMAYELMIRYRALNGFAHGNSGRYIDPGSLNKIERQTLKFAFRTIDELQSLIRTRFSLNYFGT